MLSYYSPDSFDFVKSFVLKPGNAGVLQRLTHVKKRGANIGIFFFKVGALTFGGGLSMIAFIHEQVVYQLQWLTSQEFIDGLALGQLTPGPILMVAAYVGYKAAGTAGAALAAAAIFLPAFMMMLALAPILDRVRTLASLDQSGADRRDRRFARANGAACVCGLFCAGAVIGAAVALLRWRTSVTRFELN